MKTRSLFRLSGLLSLALLLGACHKTPPVEPYFDIHLYSPSSQVAIPDELIISSDETLFYVEVNTTLSDDDWTITSSEPWCRIVKAGDLWDLRCDFYTDEALQPRTCTVRIDAGTLCRKTFTVIQQGNIFFDLPENIGAVRLSAVGETLDRYVHTNAYKWTVETSADWLSVSQKDARTLTLTAQPRPDGSQAQRKATVKMEDVCFDMYGVTKPSTTFSFDVTDTDPTVDAGGYDYGDHIDWN